MFFIWHVIQGWSEGLIVTILLGMDLSAACIIASDILVLQARSIISFIRSK